MKRRNEVKLVATFTGEEKTFEVSHAERILRMGRRSGYALPDGSEYEFDERYGIRLRTDKRSGRKAGEAGDPE